MRKVEGIRKEPLRYLLKLKGESAWHLRVRDHRSIVDVDPVDEVLVVLRLGHRVSIY